MPTIIYDTETTGLPNPDAAPLNTQPRIIEFAAIKLNDDLTEHSRLEFICDPGHDLSDKITEITGLKTSDVKGKPSFAEYYPQLAAFFLGVDTIVAHNLAFDINMLSFDLRRINKQYAFPWPPNQICTAEKTMHINGFRLNLTKLHKHCTGIENIQGAHRAMVDVEALLTCYVKLVKDGTIK